MWFDILKVNFTENLFFEFVEEYLQWGNLDNPFIKQRGGNTQVRPPLTMKETNREERQSKNPNVKGKTITIYGDILINNVVIANYASEIYEYEDKEPYSESHINVNHLNNKQMREVMKYFVGNISGKDLELWEEHYTKMIDGANYMTQSQKNANAIFYSPQAIERRNRK